MQVVYERCCGIDVHKKSVVVCAIVPGLDGQPQKETRTLATMTEDLEAFHLASWAGICPGNNESAGKRKSRKTRRGSPWLRRALVEAVQGAARTETKVHQALYHRLVARRGKQRALMAVGHSLLVTGFYLITRQTLYQDPGQLFR